MTALRRSRFVPTEFLRVGAHLPPQRTWDPSAPGQVIVAYQPGSEWCKIRVRDEGTGEEYDWRFTPRQGFPAPRTRRRSEAAEMPGHIPGTTAIDWSKVDRPPLAGELQEGDVLPPKDEKLATEEIGHLFMQRVARVSLNHQGMLQLYLSDRDGVFAP